MTNSNNNQSQSLWSSAFGVAKKLSANGLNALSHVAPGTVAKMNLTPNDQQSIEGEAQVKQTPEPKKVESPQQMLREHLPQVSHQLLGRNYNRIYSIASFFSPDINEKISNYAFDRINAFTEQISSVDKVMNEAGIQNFDELKKNPHRSQRLSQALIEQNKIIAVLQGALSGATGVIGAAVDVPVSLVLSLRTVYQTGRAHGFELGYDDEQEIVEYIFKEIDLGLMAEKQTFLVGLRGVKSMLESNNVYQLQDMLGSSNDAEFIQNLLFDEQGQAKYQWLNQVSRFSVLGKLTPVAEAAISAVYSWRLIEDAGQKSQAIFGGARRYLLDHPEQNLSPLKAYLNLEQSFNQQSQLKSSKAAAQIENKSEQEEAAKSEQEETAIRQDEAGRSQPKQTATTLSLDKPIDVDVPNSAEIEKITIQSKAKSSKKSDRDTDQAIEKGIDTLANEYVEPHDNTSQQPALTQTPPPEIDSPLSEEPLLSRAQAEEQGTEPEPVLADDADETQTPDQPAKSVINKATTQKSTKPKTSSKGSNKRSS